MKMQKDSRNLLTEAMVHLQEASQLLYDEGWKRWEARNPEDPKSVDRASQESSYFTHYSLEVAKIVEKLKKGGSSK